MISLLCIATFKGEILVIQQTRNDVSVDEVKNVLHTITKKEPGLFEPFIKLNGTYGHYVRRSHLIILALSKQEMSKVAAFYFLEGFCNTLKDFCGTLNETAISNNTTMLHEIILECLADNGCIQTLNTSHLRSNVTTDPVVPVTYQQTGPLGEKKNVPGTAADKPVVRLRSGKGVYPEIYVDVVENICAHFRGNGSIRKFELQGNVIVKSFIPNAHYLQINVADFIHLKKEADAYPTDGALDYIYFDERVDASMFADNHIFKFDVDQGAMRVMTYAIDTYIPNDLPFELTSVIHDSDASTDLNLSLRLRCNIPKDSVVLNLTVRIPVPPSTRNVMSQVSAEHCKSTYVIEEKEIIMRLERFVSQEEVYSQFKLVNANQNSWSRQEAGPIILEFEVSNFLCSKFAVKSVNAYYVSHHPLNVHGKWIRHLSTSESYYYEI